MHVHIMNAFSVSISPQDLICKTAAVSSNIIFLHCVRPIDLLVYFKYYLPDTEYQDFMSEFQNRMCNLLNNISTNAFDNIRGQMGIKNLADLDLLKQLPKPPIPYNRFDKFM